MYLVATPIGNARDITLRALDILISADVLAAEDTRSLRRLMDIHGVALGGRPLLSYHDHNGDRVRPRLLQYLSEGASVAYASEAGTPLLADPGYDLGRAATAQGAVVTAAPGASALLAALCVGGLPTDRFLFGGFLPNTQAARRSALSALREVPATLVFYESPKRLAAMLADAVRCLGPDRPAAMARELTKKFEECRRLPLGELAENMAETSVKGEVVVMIARGEGDKFTQKEIETKIEHALETMSVRDASDAVAGATGLPRRKVYQIALELARKG